MPFSERDIQQQLALLRGTVAAIPPQQNSPELLTQLSDVSIGDEDGVAPLADGDVLTWVAGQSAWENLPPSGGSSSFPITFDDGTTTYEIAIVSGALRLRTITDAGTVLNEDLQLSPTGITLDDSTVNGITFNTGGVGSNGGFFVTDSGGGMSLNTSKNANFGATLTTTITGGSRIRSEAPEMIFADATAAPASGDIAIGEFALWLDDTSGLAFLNIKARDAGNTIRTATIALT